MLQEEQMQCFWEYYDFIIFFFSKIPFYISFFGFFSHNAFPFHCYDYDYFYTVNTRDCLTFQYMSYVVFFFLFPFL